MATSSQSTTTKIWYLKQINLFKEMTKEEMMALAKMVQEKTFKKKDPIYLPGDSGKQVYLLKKGVVKISRITPDGRELTLTFLKPGEIFGELEAVEDCLRDTQAEAHNDVLICILRQNHLLDFMKTKPELGIRLSKLMGFRRHVIESRLENLVFRSIPQRLAFLLLELGQQFGENNSPALKINIPLTHQDIANLVGAARQTVTETLLDFKSQGLIEMVGKGIMLKNPQGLKNIA